MSNQGVSLSEDSQGELADHFRNTRARSSALVAPLSNADATIQSMEDASPAKWHLAHTTWFWETFLLRDHMSGYELFDSDWPFLFNSYYEAEGQRIARFSRGMLSRPSLDEIIAWREHVDNAIAPLLDDPNLAGIAPNRYQARIVPEPTWPRHVARRAGEISKARTRMARASRRRRHDRP